MATILSKYFQPLCILVIFSGIIISKVKASVMDCLTFYDALPYFSSDFAKNYEVGSYYCCGKPGITCGVGEYWFTGLSFTGESISNIDKVFDIFSSYSQLVSLEMKDMKIVSNSIPSSIINFNKLETLVISNSNIQSIPAEVGTLENLRVLDLSNNDIEGDFTAILSNLQNLETLNLSGNKNLKGYIPPYKFLADCNVQGTGLCSTKDNVCGAPTCSDDVMKEVKKEKGTSDKKDKTDDDTGNTGNTDIDDEPEDEPGPISKFFQIAFLIVMIIISLVILYFIWPFIWPFIACLFCITVAATRD